MDLEALALAYVSNSDVIKFFESLGVSLDVFYSLLWRHVFTVELLKKKFQLTQNNHSRLIDRLRQIFDRDKRKELAVNYLQEWGNHFWEETEYRVKEFVRKLEDSLSATVDANGGAIKLNASAAEKLSDEVKGEVINRAQKVVNEVQIKDLGKVIDLLADDLFSDTHSPFYITIDKLDEAWATDRIKYKLIRALLETVRSFQRIPAVKIIVSLRVDLLERVFIQTRDSGFQEEKYESLYLFLRWSGNQLKQLLESRLGQLYREQYTTKPVGFDDIFPNKVNGQNAFDYMSDRTFNRPRDIILFVNCCLDLAEGKSSVPAAVVKEAEAEYSRKRLRSLADEWIADYPHLFAASGLLSGRTSKVKVGDITYEQLEAFTLDICMSQNLDNPLYKMASEVTSGKSITQAVLLLLIKTFYNVGMIGVKPEAFNEVQWSFKEKASIPDAQLEKSTTLHIHPMIWRALGINLVTST